MLPFPPDAIVFDMDGLLFDSERLYLEAFLAAANEGKYNAGRDTFLPMLGRSWQDNRTHLAAQLGEGASADDFRALWQRQFEQRLAADAALPALKTGARELIDLAVAAGLPIAIATSSAHATVQHHLTVHGLSGHFHAIVAHGDYARSKPQPDPYLKAAERLGVRPERCLALEDSLNGVRSAASAGMMTIMVPDLIEPSPAITEVCVAIARDLAEVARLVRKCHEQIRDANDDDRAAR